MAPKLYSSLSNKPNGATQFLWTALSSKCQLCFWIVPTESGHDEVFAAAVYQLDKDQHYPLTGEYWAAVVRRGTETCEDVANFKSLAAAKARAQALMRGAGGELLGKVG